jgi:hypothetical protein
MFAATLLIFLWSHQNESHNIAFMKTIILTGIAAHALSSCQISDLQNQDWTTTAQNILNSPLVGQTASTALSNAEITDGLREALRIGTNTVVTQLGQSGGFSLDPKIQIPLPGQLQKVDDALSKIGLNNLTNDLKSRMNSAAELATPKAKALFMDAITSMTITDAKEILFGADNAATTYLRSKMSAGLTAEMQPLIQNALNQAGAIQAYDRVIGQYAALPFMPDVKADLQNYVTDKTLDGIFYYVAQEEAAIRNDPAKRTTEILQKVFAK